MARTTAVRRARGRPKRFEDRRDEVLRAAARVFSDRGFRHATLEDVAGELGITRPALYHYAHSKDALLAECGAIARQQLIEAVGKARAATTGADRLASFFRQYAQIICDEFGRCFVLTDRSEIAEDEREANRRAQRALATAVSEMVATGMEDGSIEARDPADVSRAMFAAFNGIPKWRDSSHARSPLAVADAFVDLFLVGLTPRS